MRELATRVYLADALEILEEDPQRALIEEIGQEFGLSTLYEHKFARKRLDLRNSGFEIELISFWIMNQFDENYGAVLCNSSGNLLKANHAVLFHPDQFSHFYLEFPLREMSELCTVYQELDAGRMIGRDFWDRYCCLDAETGVVKEKNQTKRVLRHYFGDPFGSSATDGVFESNVLPFVGSCVVFDPSVYPDNYYDFYASICLLNKHWTKPESQKNETVHLRKRGPKPAPAKREYLSRYPDGPPDGVSAEAIALELTEAGFPITGRSIQTYERARKVRK
ncbi:hypothetical protein [Aliiroseovarius sp. S253]|uniref:hypothetical protein n=1 Tax=Aliiroseovarius sp. S253 TaxID=3415133 RepID=UPI003C7E061C